LFLLFNYLLFPVLPVFFLQGQVVFLKGDVQLGAALVAVHLADDLCGSVQVGDRVLATGCGRYCGGEGAMTGAAAGQVPVTLSCKVRGGCGSAVMGLREERPARLGLS
jgi:hypothetical protein